MPKTNAISTSVPPDRGETPALGASRIRTLALATVELIAKDHYTGASSPYNEDAAGEHAKVTLRQATKPGFVADKGFIYTKDVSGTTELFYEDEAGNEVQFTRAGKIILANSDYTLANNVALKGTNASGTATVDAIKIGTDNLPVVGGSCKAAWETSSGDAVTTLMTKGYTETKMAADIAAIGGLFGEWLGRTNDTSYEALTDGWVLTLGTSRTRGYTDGSDPPTTQRVDSYSYDDASGYGIRMPVRKGDYWKVTGATTVYWLPTGA